MKLIIAGSRTIQWVDTIAKAIEASGYKDITEVVCGCANGADKLGAMWAELNKIPVKHFPANWKEYGVWAGPIRNGHMGNYGEALLAVWDGKSTGTQDMIKKMQKEGKPYFVYLAVEVTDPAQ